MEDIIVTGGGAWIEAGSDAHRRYELELYRKALSVWKGSPVSLADVADDAASGLSRIFFQNFILPQDSVTIKLLRDLYTKTTGRDWKTAGLKDIQRSIYLTEGFRALTYPVQQIHMSGGVSSGATSLSPHLQATRGTPAAAAKKPAAAKPLTAGAKRPAADVKKPKKPKKQLSEHERNHRTICKYFKWNYKTTPDAWACPVANYKLGLKNHLNQSDYVLDASAIVKHLKSLSHPKK